MASQQTRIEKAVHLALGGATVLAANTRAARTLRLEAEARALHTKSVCETPDILPLEAWISRTWTECLLAEVADRALLKPNVVNAFWEQLVANSTAGRDLLSHRAAAELAARAWRLICDYKLPRSRSQYLATAETRAFYGWAEAFEARCHAEGWIDSAAALQTFVARCSHIPKLPRQIVVFGFDQFTPLQQDLWFALRAAGVDVILLVPESRSSFETSHTLSCDDSNDELRTAALWARRKLEADPQTTIGVLVPDLENLRHSIETVFAECLHPELSVLSASRPARCFEISLGNPLSDLPIIRTALRLLRLATSSLPAAEFSILLRSPFLGGGTREACGRALLDFQLRKNLRATVTISELLSATNENLRRVAPQVFRVLSDLERATRKLSSRCTRSEWAAETRRLLTSAGWPGDDPEEFTLSPAEFQATSAWDSLLSDFGALDQILPPRAPADLQRELDRAAADATFAVENEAAPIQIIGPLAASGESFDALWFCGLSDDAWPQRGHPNPFIPYGLQKEAATPHATPQLNLQSAEQVTARVLQSARECVLSWPRREEDRDLRPSPLLSPIAAIAYEDLPVAASANWNERQKDAALEEFVDEQAPALTDAEFRNHSTKLLEWQSGCPFRAFAQVRLSAERQQEPTLGAGPIDRGKVTELALQYVWEEFRGLQELEKLTVDQVERSIALAIDKAILKKFPKGEEDWLRAHREIERERLNKLIHEWLAVERKRAPFHHIVHQAEVEVRIGELTISGRIDRIEQTNEGAYVIIDYKTGGGSYSARWWEAPRPQDPQLPIYAVAQTMQGRELAGVAFARVRVGKCDFQGEAARKEIFGKTQNGKQYDGFPQTLDSWRPELERLAADFLAGRAKVDPNHPPATSKSTCKLCHLGALCRVAESAAALDDDENDEASDDE